MLTVADILGALTSKRPYRNALTRPEALGTLAELADEGKLDPAVVRQLGKCLSTQAPQERPCPLTASNPPRESHVGLERMELTPDFLIN